MAHWLGEARATGDKLKAMLVPYPAARDDVLAGEQARRQHQDQRSELDRADPTSFSASTIPREAPKKPVGERSAAGALSHL